MHNAFLHLFGKFMAEGLGFSTPLQAVLDAQPWVQTIKPRMLKNNKYRWQGLLPNESRSHCGRYLLLDPKSK